MKPSRHPWPAAVVAALIVIAIAAGLALLYLARAVLVPVTLAMLLSFAAAPLVRAARRIGLGPGASVFAVVLSVAAVISWIVGLIGFRAVRIGDGFPAYRETFVANVQALRRAAVSPMEATWGTAERWIDARAPDGPPQEHGIRQDDATSSEPIAIVVHPPRATPIERLRQVLSWAWAPIGSTAIVIVVTIFALLEHQSLRDRFIRLVGGADLRATTTAINDAGERLSRYLARLFAVNIGVGVAVWLALSAIGLPCASLIAALTALLRFVPFVGVPVAATFALVLAIGAAPGWTLALWTLAAFTIVELVVAHAVEPRVYGHATGLSPLAVVLSAILWGGLWGPVGVLIATPLTLCLATAGRHFESLAFLGVVLGDGPALTMAQKFYQRALSGDPAEIVELARRFLERRSFADYCDIVLLPALQLGRADCAQGKITSRQYDALRFAIVQVLSDLDAPPGDHARAGRRTTVLEDILTGSLLRRRSDLPSGMPGAVRKQGVQPPMPARTIVLCMGMGFPADELAAELLVRILRESRIDARHIKDEDDLGSLHVYGIATLQIDAICLVTMTAPEAPEHGVGLAKIVKSQLPWVRTLGLLLPGRVEHPDRMPVSQFLDQVATSFSEAVRELLRDRANAIRS